VGSGWQRGTHFDPRGGGIPASFNADAIAWNDAPVLRLCCILFEHVRLANLEAVGLRAFARSASPFARWRCSAELQDRHRFVVPPVRCGAAP